ncbi:proline--tRNA ligase [Caldilinea sp.]|uniref:proline--tRNA ligase n=1 Tax=Caldilinea sp. TaxID=2293560 RepID=UPI002B71E096|nr:proline--tRNA ligase [Caldilinea sp.]
MRVSKLFFQTFREAPADADIVSHQLMLRAGLIHQIAAGIFDFLPMALRTKHKIEDIFREEMDAIGGQEVTLPVVHPAELWQKTGRWYQIGSDMARFKDRNDRDMVLAMTHEEIMADLAKKYIKSYRQLPTMLYQIQTKFRDEPRPRAGLLRVREFTMKDAYTFDRDEAGIDAYYPHFYQAYFNIFRRSGIDVVAVKSDTGMMGGRMAHEFMALTDIGEDTLVLCDACGYSANRQVATFRKPAPPATAPAPLEEVATPNVTTIEALASFLNIAESETAKAVFMVADIDQPDGAVKEQFVFCVVRGDMELNETKLTNVIKARRLRPATTPEIQAVGAEPGYGSPIGIRREQVLLLVDDLVARTPNLVAGANRAGYHARNTNYGRDYTADLVVDLVAASDGHACPQCGEALYNARGVEVGNIFKLGTKYSKAMGATYLDEKGDEKPIVMGSYGIGSGRLMAVIIEMLHDDAGIKWPITVAPYQVLLVSLATEKTPEVTAAAEQLYATLLKAGVEVLYDDREERAGVKFNDADLLGIPIRLTVGAKGLKNGIVEGKLRRNGEMFEFAVDAVVEDVCALVAAEIERINATAAPVPFEDK